MRVILKSKKEKNIKNKIDENVFYIYPDYGKKKTSK